MIFLFISLLKAIPYNYDFDPNNRNSPKMRYTQETLIEAIREVFENGNTIRKAAIMFNVPRSTLTQKVHEIKKKNLMVYNRQMKF